MATDIKISLKAARVNSGLTRDDVAKKIGKSIATIVAWEEGYRKIKANDFSELADMYNIPMDNIFLP